MFHLVRGNAYLLVLVLWVLWPLLTYIILIFFICWCMSSSPTFTCVVSFLSLYTCFLFLYTIYYFWFTLRCIDEFCLKCFRNTGCQSLLAINSLLAKFFKKGKTQIWMQSSMQLNQGSKQHFELSKSSLNNNFKHIDPKNTHTH